MAAPIVLAAGTIVRVAVRAIPKGAKALIRSASKAFKRKSNKKPNSKNKDKARKNENDKLNDWIDKISDWVFKNVKNVEKTQAKQQETKEVGVRVKNDHIDIDNQGFIKKKFFYKKQKFTENKVLNDILNDLSKNNKLKEHNLNELQNRIDFTFNKLLRNKEIKHIKEDFKNNKKDNFSNVQVSKFPEPNTSESSPSIWDFFSSKDEKPERKKTFRRKLKELRVNLRNKVKNIKEKISSSKEKIKRVFKPSEIKPEIQKDTKTKSVIKSEHQKAPKKVEEPTKKDIKQDAAEIKKEAQQDVKKTTPAKKYEEIEFNKSNSKYPELEKGLSEFKSKDLELQEEIKGIDKKYYSDKLDLENKLNDIKADLDKESWYSKKALKLRTQRAKLLAKEAKLSSQYYFKILYAKGEGLLEQTKHVKEIAVRKVNEITKSLKTTFPRMFKLASSGIKAMLPLVRRIPLIGSVIYAILAVIDISKARNAWEVRKAIGRALGGSIGGILGAAIGSILPVIGTIVFGVLGALLGELLGETAVQYGLEPSDFLSFDLYDAPMELKQADVVQNYELHKGELYNWAIENIEPMMKKTVSSGEYLDVSSNDISLTSIVKNSASATIETISEPFEESQSNFNSVNPEAIDGAVIKVVRQKAGIDWQGRGFVAGQLSIIDGTGKTIFKAQTTERPVEGVTPNKNLRIPAGTYNMFWGGGSKHPDRPVLYNNQVPASRAIMIHKGNSVAWTAGCVVISYGNPWNGVIGKTGEKSDAERAGHELMLVLKALQGLNPNKKYFGKEITLKTQIFNQFDSGDLSAGKKAKGAETYQEAPQETINKNTINNTTILLKSS